jgi:hypothetical protein
LDYGRFNKYFTSKTDMHRGRSGVLDTTLCVSQLLAADRWFSPGTPVSSTNKTDCHDKTEILLKVALNTKNKPNQANK